jgi:DNA polymerase-1
MRTLLIDGDVIAYQVAFTNQTDIDWGDETTSTILTEDRARNAVDQEVERLLEHLKGDEAILCLTDGVNFRMDVLPSYKSNRKDVARPLLLPAMREHILTNHKSYLRATLEGDDCMGILATHPSLIKGEKVIVSIDKDMKTIPTNVYNPNHDEDGIVDINEDVANWWHMLQTIMGDTTDGYKGCPNAGKDKAEKLLANPYLLIPYEYEFTKGAKKGTTETRWNKEPTDDVWASIVSLFEQQGLTEADALAQARVARILRSCDYNFKTKEVILWNPPKSLTPVLLV